MMNRHDGTAGRTPSSIGPRQLLDTEEVAPGVSKVNLRGRLDANGVQRISPTFERVAETQARLIVDLSRVTFIGSTGLRTLIGAARRVAAHDGLMVLLAPEPSVESVLITSGTDMVIPIFQELVEAILAVCVGDGDDDDMPAASLPFSLQVDRSMRGVARSGAWVDELAILLNLSQRAEYALRLCLEEAITAISTRARPVPGAGSDKIDLRLIADADKLILILQDQCEEYNPLQGDEATSPDEQGADDVGLNLLRQHARDLTWSRVGATNRLMLTIPR